MKKITVFAIIISLFSCGDSKKEKQSDNEEVFKGEVEVRAPSYEFPEVDNLLSNPELVNLTNLSHSFDEDIVFNEINVLKKDEDTYDFIFILDGNQTDFEKLSKWKIGMYLYAKNPENFLNVTNKSRGYTTMGILPTPKVMGEEVVVVLENFKIVPKELTLLRLYLYNGTGETNNNFYNVENIILP